MKKRIFLLAIQTKKSLTRKFLFQVVLCALCITLVGCATIPPGDYPTNVDIDIDSDNNNVFSEPDRSTVEDEMEDHLSKPGRIVVKNDDDNDGDQVPDFADGFNLDGIVGNEDDINPSQQFVPLVVEISRDVDMEQARIRVIYNESIPADTKIHPEEPSVYEPEPGSLRIWAQPGDTERNAEHIARGGDFVIPSEYHPEQLGLTNSNRTVTWYVEGIQTSQDPGDQEIIIEVDPDGSGPAEYGRDVVRLTVIDMQFMTQGPDGELVDQQYTFNSVPAPELQVVVQNCQMDHNRLVTLDLTGSVIDFTSGLVPDSNRQLQQITISPQNQGTYVIDLQNSADPEPPWQPYKFEASFSASVELQTRNDSGEYWVSVSTGENPAGVAANLMLFVIHNENEVFCVERAATEPGSVMPTIIRIDAPPRTFEESETFIGVFDADWALDSRDLGDGQFLYAVDMMDNIAVFLPALYASSIDPYMTMKPLDLSLNALIKINKAFLAGAKLVWKVSGLRIQNDDISISHLGKIDNYSQLSFKTTYAAGDIVEYIYAPKAGGAGNLDNSLNTEILYRYINFGDTIVDFVSKAELDNDIKHRLKVVDTVKNEQLGFPNAIKPTFNSSYWINNVKVKAGVSAATAVKDIFAKPQTFKYYMGCALGATYSVETGAIEALGNQEFDKRVGQYPSPQFPGWPYGKAFKVLKVAIVKGAGDEKHVKWIPGDWGYITNSDPNPKPYLEGENIIYVGGQAGTITAGNFDLQFKDFYKNAIFWGHGGAQQTFEQWYIKVDGWYTAKKAAIEAYRIRLRQKP